MKECPNHECKSISLSLSLSLSHTHTHTRISSMFNASERAGSWIYIGQMVHLWFCAGINPSYSWFRKLLTNIFLL